MEEINNNKDINISNKNKKEKMNEIIITIKIDKDDVDKKIYFLNYPYYINDDGISRPSDDITELNKDNTIIYINNNKYEYKKYINFSEKGIYIIKLLYNFNLTNASCMFLGCEKIININFNKCNTNSITNMCAMFRGCKNIYHK